MRTLWLKAALVIAAVWLVAGGVIWLARASKPTPESLERFVEAHPLTAGNHAKVLETVAKQLNELSYEERREVRLGRKLDGFFRQLDSDEQARFLDLTLPTGFKQMMEAFNKMEPEKRKRFVDKALEEMKQREGEPPPPVADESIRQKMVQQGLKSFYSDASAEVKMDVSPLIEQMQKKPAGSR